MTKHTDSIIAALNCIAPGWTEGPGGLLCTSSPAGGIIDKNMAGLGWFIIFNDDRKILEGFNSRDDAVEAYLLAS